MHIWLFKRYHNLDKRKLKFRFNPYHSTLQPEKAIEVYESALKKNPRDYGLAQKIGQALVKTHNYNKAINYYEAALKAGGQARLRYDLAELLVRIRQYDKAEKILNQALEGESSN